MNAPMNVKLEHLLPIECFDERAETLLKAYSDTLVLDMNEGISLVGMRIGGYAERTKAFADAVYHGMDFTLPLGEKTFTIMSHAKRYSKTLSHDGLYAEAALILRDDDLDESEEETRPRNVYLWSEDEDSLFSSLDEKVSIPLLPEFKDWLIPELKAQRILNQCRIISTHETFQCWRLILTKDEGNLRYVLEQGLKSNFISLPNKSTAPFPRLSGITSYLKEFGRNIAKKIKNHFTPLFNPATETLSQEILTVNDAITLNLHYSLYPAQLAVSESLKRRLDSAKFAMCIGEPGSGKTKIAVTALNSYQLGGASEASVAVTPMKQGSKHFNLVICPSHLTKKWQREITETLPDAVALTISSITDLNVAYSAFENDTKDFFLIFSKEKARDGYQMRPAVNYNKRQNAFLCPTCFKPITTKLMGEYNVKVNANFFKKENRNNRKCPSCKDLLWTFLIPNSQSAWVKIADYGFVHRDFAHEILPTLDQSPALYDKILAIAENPDDKFPTTGAYRRYPISTYVKNHMKGKIDALIVDEIHQYVNNSGQGDAMAELYRSAKKVLGLTGTLVGGYASGLFHLLYRVSPNLMQQDEKPYENPLAFNSQYGVTESVYEQAVADYNSNRRTPKRKLRERQLPGVSPLVYSRFLMDSSVFLSLNDISDNLPEYEEFPIELKMSKEVQYEYLRLEAEFKYILRNERKIATKLLSTYLNLLTVFPDQPYSQPPVFHPITGDIIITPTNIQQDFNSKDEKILELVQEKVEAGEKCLIYTSWTRIDTQAKLFNMLSDEGFRVSILTSKVPPTKREEWVEKQIENNIEVLICNPSLVETGLDLNDFTTLIYYNISYNLFTLRQSSRRSWRINQKAPRIEVYFLYFNETIQHRAISLMASKLAVAGIIEGNLSDEGLAALSNQQDLTSQLARELTNGLETHKEDLVATFKKLALLRKKFPEDFDPFSSLFEEAFDIAA